VGRDLQAVEARLAGVLGAARDPAVREMIDFLLQVPGKRIRPALALLAAGAARARASGAGRAGHRETVPRRPQPPTACGLPSTAEDAGLPNGICIDVATSVELVHMASLIHDDLIDGAVVRHHRPSVPARWGRRAAGFAGDYLCARACQLVADCADPRLLAILGAQLAVMCEGELQQVEGRGDFELGERRCLAVIEKKTASLFGACCGLGAVVAGGEPQVCRALQEFGFHAGIAFQILDDCRDLLGDPDGLGKTPGQDWQAGDVTLPLLYAMQHQGGPDLRPPRPGRHGLDGRELARLGEAFRSSPAPARIAEWVESSVGQAQRRLAALADSDCKQGLARFAEHITVSVRGILAN